MHLRLGHVDKARKRLDQAGRWIEENTPLPQAVVRFLEKLGYECLGPDPNWQVIPRMDQRTAGRGAQICFSNPEVVARTVQLARAHFDHHPSQVMFSLSANDAAGFCQCSGCGQLGDNPGGQTLAFANAVATELRQTHPDKYVAFIAYYATHEAPRRVQAVPGVIVFYINQSCRAHSLDHAGCPSKKPELENLQAWRATGAEVTGIYEYYMTSWGGWKHVPAILGDAALRDLRYHQEHGVKYMYYEGAQYAAIEDCPIQWPLHYVAAKGMWNPHLTARQILEPACQKLFGAAAELMLAFYLECAQALEACPGHSTMWNLPQPQLAYTPEVVKTIQGLLDKAEKMAQQESPQVVRRIRDVTESWERTEQRLIEETALQKRPKRPEYLPNAINGRPGVNFPRQTAMVVPTLPGSAVPSGDCEFTLFFVGVIPQHDWFLMLSWGDMFKIGRGSALEIHGGTLKWTTGWGADAATADGSFNDYFDQPVILGVRKRPGPIKKTTSLWINGQAQPLSDKSSDRKPNVQPTDIRRGSQPLRCSGWPG